jgi:sugar lactone lactonase YvrE
MVVDESGRAYVGNIVKPELGDKGEDCIILLDADGGFRIATSDISSPNGMLISATGDSLIVAETPRNMVVSFDILADGTLAGRRVICNVSPSQPDGICGDAEGAIWVSGLQTGQFLRVLRDGQIVDRISVNGRLALACVLGGPKKMTLFMMTAETTVENARHNEARGSRGFVEVADVSVPGAGIP